MDFHRIRYDVGARRARITLQRPEKRNALDDVMVRELTSAFLLAAEDETVKVVLLAATGSAFCAGADLQHLEKIARYDLEENRADSGQLAQLFRTIHESRKPTIAIINGPALAGGCGLACACDFIVASEENASFGFTEVRIGFIPAVVLVFLVKRVGEGRARELVLRGNILSAREAEAIGLVSSVVLATDLDKTTSELADELITNNSLTAMGLSKELLSKLPGMSLPEALDFAANMNAAARMTSDCRSGIGAFLRKERIQW